MSQLGCGVGLLRLLLSGVDMYGSRGFGHDDVAGVAVGVVEAVVQGGIGDE